MTKVFPLLLVCMLCTASSCFSQDGGRTGSPVADSAGISGHQDTSDALMGLSGFQKPSGDVAEINLDSIFQIIDKAKVVDIKSEIKTDSVISKTDTVFTKLTKDQSSIVQFLFKNPGNFKTNAPVFGRYFSNVMMHFKKSNAEQLYLSFDFALNKFRIIGADMQILATYDIDGGEMLRFVQSIYPDSQFLKNLNQ